MLRETLLPHKGIWQVFRDNGHEVYFVGGCVRDAMLGRSAKDIDIATDAKPEAIKELFKDHYDTGIKYGSITVDHDGRFYDVTTFRAESGYSDYRRPDTLEFTKDIKQDLRRRDFTVNAMAYCFDNGHIDLFGGVTDLNKKSLKAVGRPGKRFREDALRMMRAVRFSCELGFTIEEKTLRALRRNAKGIRYISKERIYGEFFRAVNSLYPENIVYIRNTGIGRCIHPAFKSLSYTGLPSPRDPVLRLAHMMKRQDTAMTLLEFLRADKTMIYNVLNVIEGVRVFNNYTLYGVRKLISEKGRANAKRILVLRGYNLDMYDQILNDGDCMSLDCLKINGKDLIMTGVAEEGVEVRLLLNRLLDEVLKDPLKNRFEVLLAMARELRTEI